MTSSAGRGAAYLSGGTVYARTPRLAAEVGLDDATAIRLEIVDEGAWRRDGEDAGRGHGMSLMRALMDEIEVRPSDEGTVVTMKRRIAEP